MSEDLVLFEKGPSICVVTLNRPKALNSLNREMIALLSKNYREWNEDDTVNAILIKGAGGKAFCAGGDVKRVVQGVLAGNKTEEKSFFTREYAFNHYLGNLKKPHIALIDGICMGGGAGVSMHGPFRIATERTLFAMPECAIGLFPDVGASHFLNKLPGQLGAYLGLTGARLKGYQVVEAGLATHLVASNLLGELQQELQALGLKARQFATLEALFLKYQARSQEHMQPTGLLDILPEINECFRYDNVESVIAAVQHSTSAWAREAKKQLSGGSPTSQKVTLRELRDGRGRSLAACLVTENRLAHNIMDKSSDFYEGVRALLIDKDNKPAWQPPSLRQVSEEKVQHFFAPLSPGDELVLEQGSATHSKL